ncbi:MAG TPA: hypothetical protein VMW17_07990 [Candidatus Binatia bacterium]|nr:hypothetical protein [Candidatus Binatia bacterium]
MSRSEITRVWSLAHLEARRDRTFRRVPSVRVNGARRALTFINDVGLTSLFATRGLNLPCLWVAVCGRRDPRFPHHSHHDPEVGLAWNLKDELPAAGKCFYARLIRGKPTFVAWDLFPAVYRLFGSQRDYIREYRDGLLSPAAKAILDTLNDNGPQETFALKLATNLARPNQRRAFDGALAELQRRLYVAMREVRYDPFTYVWDLVATRHRARVREARTLRPDTAARELVRRYLRAVVYANPRDVISVVGDRRRAGNAIEALARAGEIQTDCAIDGMAGKWIVALHGPSASD